MKQKNINMIHQIMLVGRWVLNQSFEFGNMVAKQKSPIHYV